MTEEEFIIQELSKAGIGLEEAASLVEPVKLLALHAGMSSYSPAVDVVVNAVREFSLKEE